jgi:hypothetical protein
MNELTQEPQEKLVKYNKSVEELHEVLSNEIGSHYNILIREASNSRRTNAKRLTNWKLLGVSDIFEGAWGRKYFVTTIESVRGIKKHLYDIERMVKIG